MNALPPRQPSAPSSFLDFAALIAEAAEPTPDPTPQRDDKGRFVKGNRGGPSNPFARQVAQLRAALIQRVTKEDIQQIADDLLASAKQGHLPSIRLLFLYVLGKPAAVIDPDTLDLEEWRQHVQPLPQIMAELADALMTVPVKAATDIVRAAQPFARQVLNEEFTAPVPRMDREDDEEEELPDDAAGQPRGEATANGQAEPSTNGVCRPTDRANDPAEPSPNGVDRPMGAVPKWMHDLTGLARMAGVRYCYSRRGTG